MTPIQMLKSLPKSVLPSSALVDFLHLVACGKPAVRLKMQNPKDLEEVFLWCQKWDFHQTFDSDNYISIARDVSLAEQILLIDRAAEPHEQVLGKLLGYPDCCCEFVAKVGESNIDLLASKIKFWRFCGRFVLIDPSQYINGSSLICHLPCSTQCQASLIIANKALSFIKENTTDPILSPWHFWISCAQCIS